MNVKIKVAIYNVYDFIMSHTCIISLGLLYYLLICGFTNMLESISTCLPNNLLLFTNLFQNFASEVFSNLCKSKCVSTFPRDLFPVCTMKDIKHNAGIYIVLHSKYYCGSTNMASVLSFLPKNLLPSTPLLQLLRPSSLTLCVTETILYKSFYFIFISLNVIINMII